MIGPDTEAQIRRLHEAESWPIGSIARQLGLHRDTVKRVLARETFLATAAKRPSKIEPFIPLIKDVLSQYPSVRASRIYMMAQARGYLGQSRHFRQMVAKLRPRPAAEAYLRLRSLPGEQAQVDWGHFGHITTGGARRPLMAFVMVLSYARAIYLQFFQNARMASFLQGHVGAFEAFGGIPRVILYDNLKSAVLERHHNLVRLHPTLLAFSGYHRFEPRPVGVARGNEKGRVERAIQYIRHSFFAARPFRDIDDLNAQARAWCEGPVVARQCPEDRTMTVADALAIEKPKLLPLPGDSYPVDERVEVQVGKTPYVRFDLNDYSVPHTNVRRMLVAYASQREVRIFDGNEAVAVHPRSWDKGQQVEDPAHVEALRREKARAREQTATDRLLRAAPLSQDLLTHVAEGNGNLLSTLGILIRLLDDYGAEALQAALATSIEQGTCHVHAVRHLLEQRTRERGLPPPMPVPLPDDPRVRNAVVVPHNLKNYDTLQGDKEKP